MIYLRNDFYFFIIYYLFRKSTNLKKYFKHIIIKLKLRNHLLILCQLIDRFKIIIINFLLLLF